MTTSPSAKAVLNNTAPSVFMNRYVAWIVLVLGLVITAVATLYMKSSVEKISEQEFTAQCNEIQNKTSARFYEHARILRSGAAFINASETVTREKWYTYNRLQKIEQQLPGIQGIGFSLLIRPGEMVRHIQEIRREGFPEYTVRPVGDRELYSSIIYLEPFSGRNLRAFGYDMLSEPVRRAAMERARDTNLAALSGKVVLVQETGKDVQAGTLMYVAVYRKGVPIETVEQRRAALFGWVYSPYRMNDLMQGILGISFPGKEKRLHLQIFDGERPSPESLLYSSHPDEELKLYSDVHYSKQVPLDFNGKRWTLRFTQAGGGFFSAEYIRVWLTLVSGILITLLLFAMMRTLSNSRAEALRIVEERTAQLRDERDLLKKIQILQMETERIGHVGGWEIDIETKEQIWTEEVYRIHEVDNTFKPTVEEGIKFYTPKSRPIIEQAVQRAIEYGEPFDVELDIVTGKGTIKSVHAIGRADLEHHKIIGFFQDISARRQYEEEKLLFEQQLQQAQKMESLGVLAGGIAHDFNNILAIIICNCSLGIQRPQMAGELFPEIETAAQRAAGLCRQMLAYAGKTQFVQSDLDVKALLDDMLGMLKSTLPQNVTIKPYLSGDIPRIKADAGQIRQIIMNMMVNASEAIGEEQGDIRVELTKTTIGAEKDYTGKTIAPGQYICLEVTDSGCGMDDETRRRIFEPFYTTKFVGRGLGMSAALGVITSHKGALQFSSQPGQGTTFKVYLPAQFSDSAPEPTEQITHSAWKGSGTLLLVEDEPQLLTVARKLLETLGFSVIEATNGIEALERYSKNAADIRLVVTDIGMPYMNGYQLISELKILAPTVPVVVSSGFGEGEVTSKIPPGDIAGLVSKPYRLDQLREVLKGVVEGVREG